ncbi:MAG TPA: type VII secretion target [Actinoplanes sp.]|nr:type VII secretion target [Actinoplanes sp.]
MPDYNYYSARNIEVATDGLREASANWAELARQMGVVAATAGRQSLDQSAFVVLVDGPVSIATSADLYQAYTREFEKLTALFTAAKVQFSAMSAALEQNAEWYEEADAESAQSFDGIAQGDWPH